MQNTLQKLPLHEWIQTKTTLHLYLQIIGKIRLALHPKRNHWWHVTFYLSASGITTGPIPFQKGIVQFDFDFIHHQLHIKTSLGDLQSIPLSNTSVAEFYQQVFNKLQQLNIPVTIYNVPFDPSRVKSDIPFSKDHEHKHYDKKYVTRFWQILVWIYPVFQTFSGSYFGKTSPIHLFWHSMDYVVTRFSGRQAPVIDGLDPVSKEAYSHEVVSFGFWPGDDNMPEPAFYSYTYPEPDGLTNKPLLPKQACWQGGNGNSMALLTYHDLIQYQDPENQLLNFLQSAFDAGASLGKWDLK